MRTGASYNHRDGTMVTKDICLSLVFHGRKKREKSKNDRREGRRGRERRRKTGNETKPKKKKKERGEPKNFTELGPSSVLCFPGVITWNQFSKILVTFSF